MITIAYGFEGVDECRGNFCRGIYLWIFKVIPYFEHFFLQRIWLIIEKDFELKLRPFCQ
jgi:hypothetical protein